MDSGFRVQFMRGVPKTPDQVPFTDFRAKAIRILCALRFRPAGIAASYVVEGL